MNGVTLKAWRDRHYVSLGELLRVVEPRVMGFTWSPRIARMAPGPSAERLEQLEPEQPLPTVELLRLFTPDTQVIDGEFLGYAPGQDAPRLVLRAVDSTSWDIESEDEELLVLLRKAYPDACPLPE